MCSQFHLKQVQQRKLQEGVEIDSDNIGINLTETYFVRSGHENALCLGLPDGKIKKSGDLGALLEQNYLCFGIKCYDLLISLQKKIDQILLAFFPLSSDNRTDY